jgi:hypothetical protein
LNACRYIQLYYQSQYAAQLTPAAAVGRDRTVDAWVRVGAEFGHGRQQGRATVAAQLRALLQPLGYQPRWEASAAAAERQSERETVTAAEQRAERSEGRAELGRQGGQRVEDVDDGGSAASWRVLYDEPTLCLVQHKVPQPPPPCTSDRQCSCMPNGPVISQKVSASMAPQDRWMLHKFKYKPLVEFGRCAAVQRYRQQHTHTHTEQARPPPPPPRARYNFADSLTPPAVFLDWMYDGRGSWRGG